MKTTHTFKLATIIVLITALFTSCNDDDVNKYHYDYYTAIVTVKPKSCYVILQLNDSTGLIPTNMTNSPYGDKEVRALVNYHVETESRYLKSVYIHQMDSIRTKFTVPSQGEDDEKIYGNDPLDIVPDWTTVAEDGYVTLRARTRWGDKNTVHYLNLVTGTNPDDPYELLLCHNANGDSQKYLGDVLIAFNLRELLKDATSEKAKITIRWRSLNGEYQKMVFDMNTNPWDADIIYYNPTTLEDFNHIE